MRELLPRAPLPWRLLTLCFLGVAAAQLATLAGPAPMSAALLAALLEGAVWTGAVALAAELTRRYPVEPGSGLLRLPLHLAAALAFAAVHHLVAALLGDQGMLPEGEHPVSEFVAASVAYLLFAGLAHAIGFRRRLREKELSELRLQAELGEAELERARYELQALKMELNPHFLFNSLHAVSALMHQDAKLANRMLVRVSDLLRRALASVGTQRVPLEEELDFARLFLEVEQVRFEGRLEVAWEVEEEARSASVPHMLLQPLVENAVKHGIATRGAGRVTVRARRDGPTLRLEVQDDGVGLEAAASRGGEPGSGVGLRNVRERLRQLAGEGHAFELRAAPGGGALARVTVPWREAPSEGPPPPPAHPVGADAPVAVDAAEPVGAPARRRSYARSAAIALFLLLWSTGLASLFEASPGMARGAIAWRAVLSAALNAATLTLLGAVAFSRTRLFPVRGERWAAHLRLHLLAAAGLAVAAVASKAAGRFLTHYPGELLPGSPASMLVGYLVLYAVLAAIAHAFAFARGFREKEAAELRLRRALSLAEVQRTRAELQVLKIELNPHFLFSALHAISALIPRDLKLANRIVVRLSEVLRGALRNRGAREIPLEEEIAGLEPLLEIENIRWAGQLRVEWRIDDDALDARVPPMLLLSLVEHLLQHGVARHAGRRDITITARRARASLAIELRDAGVSGLVEPAAPGDASGLAAIRVRLWQLYGDRCCLDVQQGEGAVRMALALPWSDEEEDEPPVPAMSIHDTPIRHAQPR